MRPNLASYDGVTNVTPFRYKKLNCSYERCDTPAKGGYTTHSPSYDGCGGASTAVVQSGYFGVLAD